MPSLLAFSIGFTLLLAAAFYYGFLRPATGIFSYRLKAGVIVLVIVLPFLWYGAYKEWRVPQDLAQFIEPYPARTSVMWVPDLNVDRDPLVLAVCLSQRQDSATGVRLGKPMATPHACTLHDTARMFMLATNDSPSVVIRYYAANAGRNGWVVTDSSPMALIMHRHDSTLFIAAGSDWTHTTIAYTVDEK